MRLLNDHQCGNHHIQTAHAHSFGASFNAFLCEYGSLAIVAPPHHLTRRRWRRRQSYFSNLYIIRMGAHNFWRNMHTLLAWHSQNAARLMRVTILGCDYTRWALSRCALSLWVYDALRWVWVWRTSLTLYYTRPIHNHVKTRKTVNTRTQRHITKKCVQNVFAITLVHIRICIYSNENAARWILRENDMAMWRVAGLRWSVSSFAFYFSPAYIYIFSEICRRHSIINVLWHIPRQRNATTRARRWQRGWHSSK